MFKQQANCKMVHIIIVFFYDVQTNQKLCAWKAVVSLIFFSVLQNNYACVPQYIVTVRHRVLDDLI